MTKTRVVCCECGSDRVYADAWIGCNDETDILGPYDTFYCAQCDNGDASVTEVEVAEMTGAI